MVVDPTVVVHNVRDTGGVPALQEWAVQVSESWVSKKKPGPLPPDPHCGDFL